MSSISALIWSWYRNAALHLITEYRPPTVLAEDASSGRGLGKMLEEQRHRCTLRATRGQSKEERGCQFCTCSRKGVFLVKRKQSRSTELINGLSRFPSGKQVIKRANIQCVRATLSPADDNVANIASAMLWIEMPTNRMPEPSLSVHRREFWDNWRIELTEALAHHGRHIRRPLLDEASSVV
jgi:hypothetical protein